MYLLFDATRFRVILENDVSNCTNVYSCDAGDGFSAEASQAVQLVIPVRLVHKNDDAPYLGGRLLHQ